MRSYPAVGWVDERLERRPSPIDHYGLFARAPIQAGEVVIIWGGQLFTRAEVLAGKVARYSDAPVGRDVYIGYRVEEGNHAEDYMNHSCNPNLWMLDEVTFETMRAIQPGEEVTADYIMYSEPTWISNWTCHCGAPNCRKTITGEDWKLDHLRTRYRDHFSPYINEYIRQFEASLQVKDERV